MTQIIKPSYFTSKELLNNLTAIQSYLCNNSNRLQDTNYRALLNYLFQQIHQIPSSSQIKAIQSSGDANFKLIWTNDYHKVSIWNISFIEEEGNPHFLIDIQVSTEGQCLSFFEKFDLNSKLKFETLKAMAIRFHIGDFHDSESHPFINQISFEDDFREDFNLERPADQIFSFGNNSIFENRTDLKFRKINEHYLFVFDYYDGPLSGIHMIDNEFYYFNLYDFVNYWSHTPQICKIFPVSQNYKTEIQQLISLRDIDRENYDLKKQKILSTHNLEPQVLFEDNPIEKTKMEKLIESLEIEHLKIFEKDCYEDKLDFIFIS